MSEPWGGAEGPSQSKCWKSSSKNNHFFLLQHLNSNTGSCRRDGDVTDVLPLKWRLFTSVPVKNERVISMVTSCCQDVGVGPVSAVAAVQYSGSPPLLACRPILTPQLPAPPVVRGFVVRLRGRWWLLCSLSLWPEPQPRWCTAAILLCVSHPGPSARTSYCRWKSQTPAADLDHAAFWPQPEGNGDEC